MHALDVRVFHWINSWSDAYSPFYVFLSEATKATWVRLALLIVFAALIASGKSVRKAGILAVLSWPLANGITDVLKNTFHVLRPCIELWPDVTLRVGKLDSFGTASAHSANMMAVAVVFLLYCRWWGLIPLAIAIFTGLSRIYVGVHYPSQVLLGWFCGAFAAFVVTQTWEVFKSRRNPPQSSTEDESPEPAAQ